jgi:hypothetical protein
MTTLANRDLSGPVRPLLDRQQPARVETLTLALG